jgi:L-rhamnose isomerase/sugar isomerase
VVGSADPFQLFRILDQIVDVGGHLPSPGPNGHAINFMLDQCHNIEAKIPGQIRSVLNVEQALAKALLIDRAALEAAQQAGDVLGANAVLMDAYDTDVRGVLADRREARGLPRDPMAAYAASGYQQRIEQERVGGTQASWGS